MTSRPDTEPVASDGNAPVDVPGVQPADADIAWIERSGDLFDRVEAAIEQLRPALQADGGDVTLREVEDRAIAIVEFAGKCEGCPLSQMTVKQGIELHLRSEVPEILTVDVWSDPAVAERGFRDIVESARLTTDD